MPAETLSVAEERFRTPPLRLLALEPPRAAAEMAALVAASLLLRFAPRGDGHPVVVLPGFMAGDNSTQALRRFLRTKGYAVYGWRQGRNLGPTGEVLDGLDRHLLAVLDRHGRSMSLVGWSLGGIFARRIAHREPEAVRQVITLGSPFRLTEPTCLTVPSTAIYSRTDGIAPGLSCAGEPGEHCESIEVRGSHCGLGHHPAVLHVVADRLALPEDEWAPYRPRACDYGGLLWARPDAAPGAASV
jgi:pimeloyl-ACP methyl ester carboxylesterase